MKNLFTTLMIISLLASAALFTSCNPELVLGRNIEGEWNIVSFTVDGEEWIGSVVTSLEFDFGEYDGDEGSFRSTSVDFTGATNVLQGDYELNVDGDELELIYTDGSKETYDVVLDGDDLDLEGNIDGFLLQIRGERN